MTTLEARVFELEKALEQTLELFSDDVDTGYTIDIQVHHYDNGELVYDTGILTEDQVEVVDNALAVLYGDGIDEDET